MNGDRGVLSVLLPLGFKTYTLKASALTGAFYFFSYFLISEKEVTGAINTCA